MNRKFSAMKKIAGSEKGALLISLIVIIVIFAVLGAAILSLTSTSTFTQVYGNNATKAYYMAESGFRYATMNIMTISIGGEDCLKCHSSHGKETLRYSAGYTKLPDDTIKVHGKLYNDKEHLDGGSFKVDLAPFWFEAESLVGARLTVSAIAHSSGEPQCDFPDAFPPDDTINVDGGLCIGTGVQYVQYNEVKRPGDGGNGTLTFTVVDPGSISLAVGDDIFPACRVKKDQTLSKGGDLEIDFTYAFPITKSVIEINIGSDTYFVTYEGVDVVNGKLTGLGDVDESDPVVAGLDVKADDIVTLSKTLKITSTGRYPEADADAAEKTLEYYRWVGKPMTVPIVYNTAKPDEGKLLAGGNFHWVEYENDNRGHNIFLDNGDDNLIKAPGDSGFASCGTNSCHKNLHLPAGSFGELNGRSGCKVCHFDPHPSDEGDDIWYRFVSIDHWAEGAEGAEGIEHEKWNYDAAPGLHNEYLGKKQNGGYGFDGGLGNTTTAYCTGCHGVFHADQRYGDEVDTNPWIRHPSDWTIQNSGEYANAFGAGGTGKGTYDPDVPVARTSLAGGVSSEVTLDSDMVMCLSCHHAHGSKYPDMLRWNYDDMIVGAENIGKGGNGCFKCHTEKDDFDGTVTFGQRCDECHTMHNSQNNKSMALVGSGPYKYLLRNDPSALTRPHK